MNKIVRVFLDTDMRCQHFGLREIAQRSKVNLKTLDQGEHVIFVNKSRNRVKLYSANGVLTYVWKEKGRLDMSTLAAIPYTFQNGNLNMKRAEELTLTRRLEAK